MLKHYYVVTPEYGEVVPILDFGQGPIEYSSDCIEIEAENSRDAIALGVKLMLQDVSPVPHIQFKWCKDSRDSGESPYAGVRAELV